MIHRSSLVWLFDLDNTLHHASKSIFPLINREMTKAIQDSLDCSEYIANELRVKYWRTYGATMLGMVKHHAINVDEFLARSHPIESIEPLLVFESGLQHVLKKLPGKKLIFTNSPKKYALTLLKKMKLASHVDDIISIEDAKLFGFYRPKPSTTMLKHILVQYKLIPHKCILVDDALVNLKAAHKIGLSTVWITQWSGQTEQESLNGLGKPSYCNLKIATLFDLLPVVKKLI